MEADGLFGFAISITYNSVSITHNSKMVEPTAVFDFVFSFCFYYSIF